MNIACRLSPPEDSGGESIFHLRSRIAATSHLKPVKAEVYDQSRHTRWLASVGGLISRGAAVN